LLRVQKTTRVTHTGLTRERIAENQVRFRDANERIRRSAEEHQFGGASVPFICECPSERCVTVVQLAPSTYDAIRTDPRWFFVAPGHEADAVADGADVVVDQLDDRVVVLEKIGVAGEIAEEDARAD
jgi:hypothetical protein